MNRDKAIRDSFFNVLGSLTYGSGLTPVPISSDKLELQANVYVIMTDQTATDASNFTSFSWESQLTMQIVSKQQNSVSKDVVDDVSNQIELMVTPSVNPSVNGLQQQTGWQILNVRLGSVDYTTLEQDKTKSIITKIITYNVRITKTS